MKKIATTVMSAFLAVASILGPARAAAQNIIEIDPLFEYPVAPEELVTMEDKSNYLVEHFWDAMDFKNKTALDQNALNHAFMVFSTPMRFAAREKSLQAVDKLIEKINKNPVLMLQFTKAAEESLYGPRAEVWIDEVYMRFLDAIDKNKKLAPERKKRYLNQMGPLSKSMTGMAAPTFSFKDKEGTNHEYFPMSTPTMIIFCDPTIADWRMWRMALETNLPLGNAVEKGKVNVLFIVPQEMEGWEKETATYPSSWKVGISPEIKKTYDIRLSPSVYVIDNNGKIADKNLNPSAAAVKLLDSVAQ